MASRARRGVAPIRVLPLGFALIILLGGLLLALPAASAANAPLPFLDALFTAASASCVTGLVVADTGVDFSLFGQVVILLLIQLGGLGFMTMSTVLFFLTGRRISLHDRLTMAEGMGESMPQGVVSLCRSAIRVTFLCELLGAALLALRFVPEYGPLKGLWFSLFHSVSAFCNAGFDLLGGYRSFTGYANDAYVLLVLSLLILLGGLGFTVIRDAGRARRFSRLRLHSKIVLAGTGLLLFAGTALFLLLEYGNPATLGPMSFSEKLLNALFESVTLRTAGFNAIDQYAMTDAGKGVGILLMLCGGAPAGTAGGLKITTVFTLALVVRGYLSGRDDTVAFGRTVPAAQVRRAVALFFIAVLSVTGFTILLSAVEQGTTAGAFGFWNQLYETVSAFCTVGVSVGVTGAAGSLSKIILILLMYAGRVGLLTVAMALTRGGGEGTALLRYPEEEILIG